MARGIPGHGDVDGGASPLRWRAGVGWGWIWGPEDEVGALNSMNDASRRAALGAIEHGAVYDLGVTIDRRSFHHGVHPDTHVIAYRTADGLLMEAGARPNDSSVSFNTGMVMLSDHAGTHLDGLCHTTRGSDRHWYNGYTSSAWASDFGPERASAHNIPPIVAPGVLIDIAGAKGVNVLEAETAIGVADLQDALDAQATEVRPGDVVLVRTGALSHWGTAGEEHHRIAGPDTAGITLAAARWLVEETGALLIGSDTSTVEVVPHAGGNNVFPVHQYLLVDQGIHLGELHYLEELAENRTYRFCYIALCPKVRGTTAGFALRPIALT